jgi:hypothetical protein
MTLMYNTRLIFIHIYYNVYVMKVRKNNFMKFCNFHHVPTAVHMPIGYII